VIKVGFTSGHVGVQAEHVSYDAPQLFALFHLLFRIFHLPTLHWPWSELAECNRLRLLAAL
jgi:hypothetical protein